jgi:trimeric autotransporter adhesin
MAIVNLNKSFDYRKVVFMADEYDWNSVRTYSNSEFTWDDGFDFVKVLSEKNDIVVDQFGSISGTASSIIFSTDGDVTISITNISYKINNDVYDQGYKIGSITFYGDLAELANVLSGNDVINGSASSDRLAGFNGDDSINGNAGNDWLEGWDGNDSLNGGDGNDRLIGGRGNDTLNGGTGNDRYVIEVGHGSDNITDSAGFSDVLDLRVTNTAGFGLYREGAALKIRQSGNSDITTVNNFWSSATATTAGTGYIENADLRNVDNNTLMGTFALNLGVTGGTGNDWMIGSLNADSLSGGAGNDRLSGDVGNDTLNGGEGNDTLIGGGGNDTLNGGADNDRYILFLNSGADTVTDSGGSADVLDLRVNNTAGFGLYREGAALKIRQTGNSDITTVNNFWSSATATTAGTGYIENADLRNVDNNTLMGTFALNLGVTGGTGNDWMIGSLNADSLSGGAGNDRLSGDVGNDTLNGGEGNDTLIGGGGNDTLNGGADNDRYILFLNSGADTVTDSGGSADVLDLRVNNTAGFGLYREGAALKIRQTGNSDITTVNNFWSSATATTAGTGYIENADWRNVDTNTLMGTYALNLGVTGGTGNDWMIGSLNADSLSGGAGNDRLSGDVGNDTLNGGEGNDTLIGGGGNDTLNGGADNDRYVLFLNNGADTVTDSAGSADVLDLRVNNTAGFGLYREGAALKIRQSGNSDITTVNNFWSSATATTAGTGYIENADLRNVDNNTLMGTFALNLGVTGGTGNDWMIGSLNADSLSGGAGNDRLSGDVGNDTLNGGEGNDTLIGGGGNDTLNGGADNDRYILFLNSGADTVTDSGGSADVLDLRVNNTAGFGLYREGAALKIRQTGNSDITTVNNFWSSATATTAGTGYIENADLRNVDTNTLMGTFALNLGVIGGTGNDWMIGSLNADSLSGGAGNDRLSGDVGNDTLNGDAGHDVLIGGGGDDLLNGGADNDRYLIFELTGGNDTVTDTGGTDDVLVWNNGTSSNTYVNVSRGGASTSNANLVVQVFQEGALKQTTTINNQFSATSSAATTISASASAPASAIEGVYIADDDLHLRMINGLTGTDVNELIVGTAAANTLTGNGGVDFMYGGAGNDTLHGGEGNDMLDGGAGNDALNGGNGNDRYQIMELTGGRDTVTDTGGTDDVLVWNYLPDSVTHVDVTRGGTGDANLIFNIYENGSLNQVTTINNQFGNALAPTSAIEGFYINNEDIYFRINNGLTGSNSDELIVGTSNANTISGNGGSDILFGAAGNDNLNGGDGEDFLLGGLGRDLLTGGLGSDYFGFGLITDTGLGSARDIITDFKASEGDVIDLYSMDANTSSPGDQQFSFNTTTAKANSVWYKVADVDGDNLNDDLIIYGDVNGNTTADFEIGLVGVTSITSSNFDL